MTIPCLSFPSCTGWLQMVEGCSASVTLPERLEQLHAERDEITINYKGCPSPFQFSRCLQHWGAEAPRLAVSLMLLINICH